MLLVSSPIKWNAHHFSFPIHRFYFVYCPKTNAKSIAQSRKQRPGESSKDVKTDASGSPSRSWGRSGSILSPRRPEVIEILAPRRLKASKTLLLSLVSPPRRPKWEPKFDEKVSWRIFVLVKVLAAGMISFIDYY